MPRPITASDQELNLRRDLEEAVTALRSTMNRMPHPCNVIDGDVEVTLEVALRSLADAEAATTGLATLQQATEEGAMLAASASMALQSIRHSLALLFAEMDASSAA